MWPTKIQRVDRNLITRRWTDYWSHAPGPLQFCSRLAIEEGSMLSEPISHILVCKM